MIKLTIFTPVYNREKLIERLYSSLKGQKFKDFEWLIIDDGSTDNTKKVIESFIEENKININYFFKENGGKHTAYNFAMKKVRGELFIIIDSDDIVLKTGLKKIIEEWEKIEKKEELLGISGVDLDINNKIIGNYYPKDKMICSHLEMREIYKVKGDKSEIFQTKLLKDIFFPKYENEKFLTEAILFDGLYKKYNTCFINEPLIIRDYQQDGLSDNSLKLRMNNPIGAMNYYKKNIKLCITKKKKVKSIINYIRFSLHAKKVREEKEITKYFILYPLGYIYYLFDCYKKIN